ncbi:immunity 53 family protein [Candidatus Protochlamydia phocaeensis]|uniref:immunity 53 family protein n=1 Tax=Candidatus Protochlamydia phocaeensis TaxID=1414722 RepID=UPI000837BB4A|nr:immunity 53 family protein [Candidatus Protochlamydia phocaeensis]
MTINQLELILWLQNWYQQYCDGEWEHNENITIHTIDNPGWHITIDLEGTHFKDHSFEKIKEEKSQNDWFHCFVRNGKFEGAGGPCNLVNILYIFKNWAEHCQCHPSLN